MTELILFPFGGNTREALDCLSDEFRVVAFVDDDTAKQGQSYCDIPIMGREAFEKWPDAKVVAAPGSPSSFLERHKVIKGLGLADERWTNIISPRALVSKTAQIGKNLIIMGGVQVLAQVKLGDHICILPNSVVHHDSSIGHYTLIGANVTVAGAVHIGENCYIGSGSNIKNSLEIGPQTMIGMGTNVVKSFGRQQTLVGNPARPL